MEQLFFKFPVKPTYLIEDFFLSPANIDAFNYINRWPDWGEGIYSKQLLLSGERGSGKTHLAHIWKRASKAEILEEKDLYFLQEHIIHSALILEDIEDINEELLLHLINFSFENQQFLMMTSKYTSRELNFKLPDLKSRIFSIPMLTINSPEIDLLKAVLLKHLNDRQLKINPSTLEYVAMRLDRSFSKLIKFIEDLEQLSSSSKRSITIPLVKNLLNL